MTQTEEALELMSCRRCGRFSGPELLCATCERSTDDWSSARRVQVHCANCGTTIPADQAGDCTDDETGLPVCGLC